MLCLKSFACIMLIIIERMTPNKIICLWTKEEFLSSYSHEGNIIVQISALGSTGYNRHDSFSLSPTVSLMFRCMITPHNPIYKPNSL